MYSSHRCHLLVRILILVLFPYKSYAISVVNGASRCRPTEPTTAAQRYYRNTLHPEDDIVTKASLISHVIAAPTGEVPNVSIPRSMVSSELRLFDVSSDIDFTTISRLLYSQVCVLLLSTIGFGVFLLSLSSDASVHTDNILWKSVADPLTVYDWHSFASGIYGAIPLICINHFILSEYSTIVSKQKGKGSFEGQNNPFSSKHYANQIETTQMVLRLFGRRHSQRSKNRQESLYSSTQNSKRTTSTAFCISLIVLLTGMISLSSELLYRVYLPFLLDCYMDDNSVVLLLPAILYGLSHMNDWNSASAQSITTVKWTVLIHQTLAALWYSHLLIWSGSLSAPIMAHIFYDMDTLASTWHRVNDQIDYVDRQSQLEMTGPCMKEQSDHMAFPRLSEEAKQVSYRFFHAFDKQQLGSLSEADVCRMIQYMYYNRNICPSLTTISKEFHRCAKGDGHLVGDSSRLDYSGFIEFLQRLQHHEKSEQLK